MIYVRPSMEIVEFEWQEIYTDLTVSGTSTEENGNGTDVGTIPGVGTEW